MKTRILIKMILLLPLIIFIDYVLMVLLGCASSIIGFDDSFFCGPFCFIGKGILFNKCRGQLEAVKYSILQKWLVSSHLECRSVSWDL